MDLSHDLSVQASPEEAWTVFMDLERVAGCFPGAALTDVSATSFTGSVKLKLGPIALLYHGAGEVVDRDDSAYRAVIRARGKDRRGNGTASATVTIQLLPNESSGETRVQVSTDLAISGKPAQFGRGVIQDVSDKLLTEFVNCIEQQFTPGGASEEGAVVEDASPSRPPRGEAGVVDKSQDAPVAVQPTPQASIPVGSTLMPILVRSYGPIVGSGFLAFILGYLLGRRRR